MARPALWLGGEAVFGEEYQLGLCAAGLQAGEGVGQVGAGGFAGNGFRALGDIRRLAGEDLTECCAQAENVAAFVEAIHLA